MRTCTARQHHSTFYFTVNFLPTRPTLFTCLLLIKTSRYVTVSQINESEGTAYHGSFGISEKKLRGLILEAMFKFCCCLEMAMQCLA